MVCSVGLLAVLGACGWRSLRSELRLASIAFATAAAAGKLQLAAVHQEAFACKRGMRLASLFCFC